MTYLCLIAYVVAIYVRPVEIVSSWAGFPLAEIVAAVAIAVAGLSYMAEPRKFWDLPHDKFVLGMWFAIVVSNLSWGWFGGAVLGFTEYLKIVFYYFLIRFAIRDAGQFRGFVRTIIGANVLLAVSGLVQFHTGFGLGGVPMEAGRVQGIGIFNDPNDLALTLVMVIPFLLDAATGTARGLTGRVVSLGFLAPIVAAIFYTNSRGGMIGLGVVLAAHSYRRLGRLAGAAVTGLVLAVALAWGPSRLSMIDPAEQSAQDRLQAWGVALRLFKSDPLFGVGYARFAEFHELVAHNSFVHTIAELGMLGGFFFVGIWYWLVKSALAKSAESAPIEIDRWGASVLASVLGVVACICFLSRAYWPVLYTLVGMGACHASMARAHGADIQVRTSARVVGHILSIVLAGIVVTYLMVRLFARWSAP